jgi:DNA-binding NarL/FixJ family response regulator
MANMMIVDDSPIIRRSLREIFEAMGHKIVAEAEDGREAIEAYKRNKVDLVTMDIQLPGINGIEAVRLIREHNPDANIVMISSVEQRNKVYEAIKLGAKHYIVKPYTDDKVMEVIRLVLGVSADPILLDPVVSAPVQADEQLTAERQHIETDNSAKKQRDPLQLDAPALSSLPYEVVIKDGRIVMTIQRHISEMNIRFLCNCLQGLLHYRKAKIVLELWDPIVHDGGMRLLTEFIAIVRSRKGTVAVVTGDLGQYANLKAKLKDGVYHSYGEIEW